MAEKIIIKLNHRGIHHFTCSCSLLLGIDANYECKLFVWAILQFIPRRLLSSFLLRSIVIRFF